MLNFIFKNKKDKNKSIVSFFSKNHTSKKLALAFSRPINCEMANNWEDIDNKLISTIFFFGNPELWILFKYIKENNLDWLYADKGYFGRGKYYRISKNSIQLNNLTNTCDKRLQKLNIKFKKHQKNGSKILLCPQSDIFFRLNGMTRESWIKNTITEIRKYSNRPIEIREKKMTNTEYEFNKSLENVHAVVVYTSIAGVQSVINGVPSFATGDGVSKFFSSGKLENIDNPQIPENIYAMASALANNQWTLNEIKNGLPHNQLEII